MSSLNKVMLIGNLGRDPEVRYMPSGDAIANVTLATTDSWRDKDGEKQERTEWHRVVFFGRQAEIAGEYLKKGSQIYVEGSLTTRKWTDKDGNERYTTEIRADRMQMLGGSRDGNQGDGGQSQPQQRQQSRQGGQRQQGRQNSQGNQRPQSFDDPDDEIPF